MVLHTRQGLRGRHAAATLKLDPAAEAAATKLHAAFERASCDAERLRIATEYLEEMAKKYHHISSDASVLVAVLKSEGLAKAFEGRKRLEAFAADQPEQMRAAVALLKLYAIWGPQVVRHYCWEVRPRGYLELLARIAQQNKDFGRVVAALNGRLVTLYSRAFRDGKGGHATPTGPPKLQEAVSEIRFPVKESQLTALRPEDFVQSEDMQNQIRLWGSGSYGDIAVVRQQSQDFCDVRLKFFHLEPDKHGLLVPTVRSRYKHSLKHRLEGTDLETPSSKRQRSPVLPASQSPSPAQDVHDDESDSGDNEEDQGSSEANDVTEDTETGVSSVEDEVEVEADDSVDAATEEEDTEDEDAQQANAVGEPEVNALEDSQAQGSEDVEHNPEHQVMQTEVRSGHFLRAERDHAVVALAAAVSGEDSITSQPSAKLCKSCGGPCKLVGGQGWTQEESTAWDKAAHEAIAMSAGKENSGAYKWTKLGIRQAVRHNDSSQLSWPRGVTEEDADILYLTSDSMLERLDRGEIFTKPVVVRETFQDSGSWTPAGYVALLRSIYPDDISFEAQDPCSNTRTRALSASEIGDLLECGIGLNLLSLPNISQAQKPRFVQHHRYRLLKDLDLRLKARRNNATTSKGVHFADCVECVDFNIFASKGPFSNSHVDALNGTWLRNLTGSKLWFIVPTSSMTTRDWQEFAADGVFWDPADKGRAILLQQDDVLLLPPGALLIHAVWTVSPCLMQGGTVLDRRNLTAMLRNWAWIAKNQETTNEPLPYQMCDLLDEIDEIALQGSGSALKADDSFRQAMAELRSLGCSCSSLGGKSCNNKTCSCVKRGCRCTPLCAAHKGASGIVSCMKE